MKTVLRFDDYSAASDTALERRLFETVASCDAKMVVSIIPFVADVAWSPRVGQSPSALPPKKQTSFGGLFPSTSKLRCTAILIGHQPILSIS